MTRRVLSLVVAHGAIAAALVMAFVVVNGQPGVAFGPPTRIAGFAAAFALVGLLPMHLEFRRAACTVTLVEAVLVIGLLFMPPAGVVIATVIGEAVACLIHRQTGLKLVYNTMATATSVLFGSVVALGVSGLVHADKVPAFAALAGVFCYAIASHTSTSAVLRLIEQRRFFAVFQTSAPMVAVATAVSSSIGLAGALLARVNPLAPLLLGPLVATVALETRRVAAHRAEHLRFERLYAASARTAGLQGFDAAIAVSAAEARSLVTGTVAVCCAPDRDGDWRGMQVGDRGSSLAPSDLVEAVVAAVRSSGTSEISTAGLPASVRAMLPAGVSTVVLAGTVDGSEAQVALAVFREIRGDDQGEARSAVLGAFVGHAALTATNARLYEEVEEALRRQVDLNRQKDDFLAAVSHELRTPLAAVLGSLATLRRLNDRLPEETKERFYDMAARQGKRLQRLIEELLLIAAVDQQGGDGCLSAPVQLTPMLTELSDELTDIAEARIVVAVAPGAEVVYSDEVKLRQVLVNLVENAAKYAPEGRIKVLAWPTPPGGVAITVVDHGPGIPADEQERVFERFVQLDKSSTRQHGGTGLGLYLCRRLTEVIGASLKLSDTPGGGCTFTVTVDGPLETLADDDTGSTEARMTTIDMDDRVPTGSQV